MIWDRLAQTRKMRHVSQQELADFVGLSRGAISSLERGLYPPKDSDIQKIAKALSVTVDYLLDKSDIPF